MIYEKTANSDPIRQGDIFVYMPRIDFDLESLPVVSDDADLVQNNWVDLTKGSSNDLITSLVAIRPVMAIVITQDCDAARIDDIALCEIIPFEKVEPNIKNTKYPQNTWKVITKNSRINLKWFYLPQEQSIGFKERMAVDFQSVLRVSRTFLEKHLERFRIARLNEVANQHFRERISEYFRRYPYDEWYSLDKHEFEEYRKAKPEPIDPFPWQE